MNLASAQLPHGIITKNDDETNRLSSNSVIDLNGVDVGMLHEVAAKHEPPVLITHFHSVPGVIPVFAEFGGEGSGGGSSGQHAERHKIHAVYWGPKAF